MSSSPEEEKDKYNSEEDRDDISNISSTEEETETDSSSSSSYSSSSEKEDDEEEDEDLSDVELSFETYNMDRERDFHPIKEFIKKIFGSAVERVCGGQVGKVDHSILTSIIVDCLSEYIGSTTKSSEDEAPLSFASLIPFSLNPTLLGSTATTTTTNTTTTYTKKKNSKARKYDPQDSTYSTRQVQLNLLFELLVQRLPFKSLNRDQRKLLSELKKEDVSLLLHYRFTNLPAQLSIPVLKQLLDDCDVATLEDDAAFTTKYLLIPTPTFLRVPRQGGNIDSSTDDDDDSDDKDEDGDDENENDAAQKLQEIKRKPSKHQQNKKVNQKKRKGNPNPLTLKGDLKDIPFQYIFEEFDLLTKHSLFFWDYKTQNMAHETTDSQSTFTKDGLAMYSRIFLVERSSFESFIQEVESLIS